MYRILTLTEQPIQPLSIIWRHNLLCICGADRCHLIRKYKARFPERSGSEKFQFIGCVVPIAQGKEIFHIIDREDALILQVMNGVYRLDMVIERPALINQFQKSRDHTCLPVITMQDIYIKTNHW